MIERWIFTWLTLLLAFPVQASGMPDEDMMQRLRAGEVIVRVTHKDESGGAAQVMFLVHSPVEQLWAVLLSCDEAFIYVKNMVNCKVLERENNRALVNHVVKRPLILSPIDVVFESLYTPYSGIEIRFVEGNLDVFEGRWRFRELPEGVLAEHEIRIKPTIPSPRFLVRHYLRKQLPDLAACLRGLADGSLTAKQQKSDLARCPQKPTTIQSKDDD